MFQTKLKIGEDLTWTIVKLTDEGTVTKTKYDLSDPNHVFEMT